MDIGESDIGGSVGPPNSLALARLVNELPPPLRDEYYKFRRELRREINSAHRPQQHWVNQDDPALLVPCMTKYAELNQRMRKAINALAGS